MDSQHIRDLAALLDGLIIPLPTPLTILSDQSDLINIIVRRGVVPPVPTLPGGGGPDPWWCHQKFDGTFVCDQNSHPTPLDLNLTGPFQDQQHCGLCSNPPPQWWCHFKKDLVTFICNNDSVVAPDDFLRTGPFDSELHCGDCSQLPPPPPIQILPPPIDPNAPPGPPQELPPPFPIDFPPFTNPNAPFPPFPPGPFPKYAIDYNFVGSVFISGLPTAPFDVSKIAVRVLGKFWRYTGQMYRATTDPAAIQNITSSPATGTATGTFSVFLYRQPGNYSLIGAKSLPTGPYAATQFAYIYWPACSFMFYPNPNPGESVGIWTIVMKPIMNLVYSPKVYGR